MKIDEITIHTSTLREILEQYFTRRGMIVQTVRVESYGKVKLSIDLQDGGFFDSVECRHRHSEIK